MAYAPEVQILNGDIVISTLANPAIYPLGISMIDYNGSNPSSIINYVPSSTPTNTVYFNGGYILFSPNGRYLVYQSGINPASATGITIFDCDLNTFTYIPTIVSTKCTLTFSADSSTVLINSDVNPYIYAIDLATKLNKGGISGAPTLTPMSIRSAAYGDYIYFIVVGAASGILYRYDKSTNSVVATSITNTYSFQTICIDSIGYVYLGTASTGAGRGIFIHDLNNMALSPAVVTLTNFFGVMSNQSNSKITTNGTYFVPYPGGSQLKAGKVTYGANVTATTMSDISPTTSIVVANNDTLDLHSVGNYLFYINNSVVPAYPRTVGRIVVCDATVLTSGKVTLSYMDGYNSNITKIAIHPSFTKRKLAGTVVDASLAPVARKVMVFSRKTGRLIAQQTSSAVDGSFEIFVYTTSQVMVIAQGTGVEVTKLIDNVVPVSP